MNIHASSLQHLAPKYNVIPVLVGIHLAHRDSPSAIDISEEYKIQI
jgi:hypothetical protein